MIGGRLEADNAAVFGGMRARCPGRLVVLATASQMPEEVGPDTVADMQRHQIDAELLPLTWDNHVSAAFDPELVARIDSATGVYFTGGDQSHLLQALHTAQGDSPVLAAIRRLGARGGLIAGSSAGAAIMSAESILGGTSLESVVYGIAADPRDPGLLLGQGFGFFPYGLVDQHFLQRGRIGRLLVAVAAIGCEFGFGIDENTGFFIDGTRGCVLGEKGVIVLDARAAAFDIAHRHYDRFRVSYLDAGDGWDFAARAALPQATRKPVRRTRGIHGPGFMQRSVFGPYAFEELLTRLAAGDATRYARDHAVAFEPDAEIEVSLGVERSEVKQHSLSARRGRTRRYTMLDYGLELRCRPLTVAQHKEWLTRHTKQLMRGRAVGKQAQLIAIGAALDAGKTELLADLRALRRQVTVIAAASAASREVAQEYVDLLLGAGIPARAFDPREADALDVLADAPAILFTGGNQDRLLQALFHLGEESPLLQAVLESYRQDGCIIAVGGSANALASAMIAGGSSEEAWCFGASPDPWYRGVVLQEGLGLLHGGLIDQHFVARNRLARLLVACVEEGVRWGLGLAEDSGLACVGGGSVLRAIGRQGFACLDLHQAVVHAHALGFEVQGAGLRWVAPGQSVDLASGQFIGEPPAQSALPMILARWIDEAGAIDQAGHTRIQLSPLDVDAAVVRFDVSVQRSPDGRRSLPEVDHRARSRRD